MSLEIGETPLSVAGRNKGVGCLFLIWPTAWCATKRGVACVVVRPRHLSVLV